MDGKFEIQCVTNEPEAAAFMTRLHLQLATLFVISSLPVLAADSLAARFSEEWRKLRQELADLDRDLGKLPAIPVDDFGEDRPFLRIYSPGQIQKQKDLGLIIRFRWQEEMPVDLVALVPARKTDSLGLDPNYGFPDDFEVSLIRPDSQRIRIAKFTGTSRQPAHRGHPMLARPDAPVVATGLEIRVTKARAPRKEDSALVVVALSEIFCFSGTHNLAAESTIEVESPEAGNTPLFWSSELLIDLNTPLGLPERPLPSGEPESIGWVSQAHENPDLPLTVTLDLGKSQPVNGLRLFPALRPSIADFPGFGIPEHFRLTASAERDGPRITLIDRSAAPTPAAGHNALDFHFPRTAARFIHLEATRLWKPHNLYPAFLALSEMQVLHGDEVVSQGSKVTVPEAKKPVVAHGRQFWSPSSIVDGNGPDGELLSRRTWIEELGQLHALENRRHHVLAGMESIEKAWQSGTIIGGSVIGLAALALVTILPFRYRAREQNRIRQIRERIAGDLHDDVGSNLGSIQMLSAIARQQNDNHDELETIHRVAAETVSSVRDIVWLLHPEKTERIATIDHLRETAAILLDPLEPLEWSLVSDFGDWTLGDEDGRNLVLFFREVLHNIRRHAGASKVTIRLSHDGKEMLVTVADNGRGIPPEILKRPTALRALHQRAARLGGKVEIQSSRKTGTRVTLRFSPRSPGSAPEPNPHNEMP